MPVGWYIVEPPMTGVIDVDTKRVKALFTGQQLTSGPIVVQLKAAKFSGVGAGPPTGSIAVSIKRALASFSGQQIMTGTEASVLKKVAVAFVGAHYRNLLTSKLKAVKPTFVGNMTPSGQIVTSTAKVISTFAEASNVGQVVSKMPKTVVVATGVQSQVGTIASVLPITASAFLGGQEIPGAEASVLAKVIATLAGSSTGGPIAAKLPPVQASLSGEHKQSGSAFSVLKKAVFGGLGTTPMPSGTIAAVTRKAIATLTGQTVANSGAIASALKKAAFLAYQDDAYDTFEDIADGGGLTTTLTGQTWMSYVGGVAVAPEVRNGYMDAPLASGGSTYYPEIDLGTNIFKIGAVFKINSTYVGRTGTGYAVGLITWADGGIHVGGPGVAIRTSGHITFEHTRAVYYYRNTFGGALTAVNTWTFPFGTLPQDTDIPVQLEYDYAAHTVKITMTVSGTVYSTTWNNANIVGYSGENFACWQGYYGGSGAVRRIEFKSIWADKVLQPRGGMASKTAKVKAAFGNVLNLTDTFAGAITDNFTNQGPIDLTVSGGIATPVSVTSWNLATCNSPFITPNQKISCTMKGATANDVLLIALRGSNANQCFMYYANGGANSGIYTNADTYSAMVGPDFDYTLRQSLGTISWVDTDVISFEVSGTGTSRTFTVKKNGTQVGTAWVDSTNAYNFDGNVGGGIGYYIASAGARGIDSVTVADL